MEKKLESALDLMRRMPPGQLEQNLGFVLALQPDLTEDVLQTVDQPLKVQRCEATGKDYLICDFNRDGDSYRSPWNNKYYPAPAADYEPVYPTERLRNYEVAANEIFNSYREMYYEGGVSSVYFWDLDAGFAAAVLIKKDAAGSRGVDSGFWNSIHIVEVTEVSPKIAKYKLTTTILLSMASSKEGSLDLSGSLTRQGEAELAVNDVQTHLVNIGNMIQDMENRLRISLDQIYFDKSREIVRSIRSISGQDERRTKKALADELLLKGPRKNAGSS